MKKGKKRKSQTVILHACAETPRARSLPYLELKLGSSTQLRTPRFVAIRGFAPRG